MISSKKIEQEVQKVEDRFRDKDMDIKIYVFDEGGLWGVTFTYIDGKNEVSKDACGGMTDEEVFEFIRYELYNYIYHSIQRDINTAMWAINKFMYYSWNYELVPVTLYHGETVYVPTFIKETKWNCNIDHIVDKWKYCCRDNEAHAYISRFYGEMGIENRRAMIKWIMENYNDEIKI